MREYTNAPTPTLFHLIIEDRDHVEPIVGKRLVRRICEALTASIGRKVRFKVDPNAGSVLVDGQPRLVAGYSIFAVCDPDAGFDADKRALMSRWWAPGGFVQAAPYYVVYMKPHARVHVIDANVDVRSFIVDTLNVQDFVEPPEWAARQERELRQRSEFEAREQRRIGREAERAQQAAASIDLEQALELALVDADS